MHVGKQFSIQFSCHLPSVPELHTITNAYLVNMAVANIIYVNLSGTLVFILPHLMSSGNDDVHFGSVGCFSQGIVSNSCYLAIVEH